MKKPKQLEFPARGRGGWRKGAGRPRGERVTHHGRDGFDKPMPYHLVWHAVDGVPGLRGNRMFRELREAFRRCHETDGFRVVHFSVQSNHVHALAEADSIARLSRGMQGLGVSMAKRINRVIGRRGPVFDDRFFARALRTPLEVARARDYVLLNGQVHDLRRGIDTGWTGPDPFSSAACRDGQELTSAPTTAFSPRDGRGRG
jgi:REP element-mobilizing transposase RayT